MIIPRDIDFADVPEALGFTEDHLSVILPVYSTVGELYLAFLGGKLPKSFDTALRFSIGRRFEVMVWELPRSGRSWRPARGSLVLHEELSLEPGISNKDAVTRLRLPQPVLEFLHAFGVRKIQDLRIAVRMNLLRPGVTAWGLCIYTAVNRRLAAAGQRTL